MKNWSIKENIEDLQKKPLFESLFTLSNGFVGIRGIIEENPVFPGTYIAGIYSNTKPVEIVNLPNPLATEIGIDGKKVGKTIFHERVLNMRYGLLTRETHFENLRLFSERFVSLKDFHLAFHRIKVEGDGEIWIKRFVDTETKNKQRIVGGEAKHYFVKETKAKKRRLCVLVQAGKNEVAVGLAINRKGKPEGNGFVVEGNGKVDLCTTMCFFTSRESEDPMRECLRALKTEYRTEFKAHKKELLKKWNTCDIEVGVSELQNVIRFNVFHLITAAPPKDLDVSIPARTLSGEWYGGHIFWDTEIFALPFYTYTMPEVAKWLLLYRYRRLEAAKRRAKKLGYDGALWPWESAESGEDETPKMIMIDGNYVPVYTAEMQHHIVGDIAYAVYNYYVVTGDQEFWEKYGIEMIMEAARFWASRVRKKEGRYVIECVIGPDEFHVGVNNNAYTNFLAKWNLELAYKVWKRYKVAKEFVSEEEAKRWKEIASKIVIPKKNGVMEQFEGYFQLPDIEELETVEDISKTKVIKQADVVLLFHLFPKKFGIEEIRKNLEYYEKRTMHMSSLSLPSYAFAALHTGDIKKAWEYFIKALYSDLKNIYGNSDKGMHLATLGGVWQLLINGFAGIRGYKNFLEISPKLPEFLGPLKTRIYYKGDLLRITVTRKGVRVKPERVIREITVKVHGKKFKIKKEGKITSKTP